MVVDYDQLADAYDRYRSQDDELLSVWLDGVRRYGKTRCGQRILDVGAGTGRFAAPLSKECYVVGIDRSRRMLYKALSKSGRATWILGDARALPFRVGSFDLVLAAYLVHQLDDLQAFAREAARVARRCLIITTDMATRKPRLLDAAFPRFVEIDKKRFPSIQRLHSVLRDAGFRKTEEWRRSVEWYETYDEVLERSRNKYISTLALLGEEDFEAGLKKLEHLARQFQGRKFRAVHEITFVAGRH